MALSNALSLFYCVFIYSFIGVLCTYQLFYRTIVYCTIVYRSIVLLGSSRFCSPAAQRTRPRLASLLGGVVVAADLWAFGVFIIFFRRDFVAAGIPNSSPPA